MTLFLYNYIIKIYSKDKAKNMAQSFIFKPNEAEAKTFELLFERFGGFTSFVRKMAQTNGYKPLPSLKEVSKKVKAVNIKEYEEFSGADGENLD